MAGTGGVDVGNAVERNPTPHQIHERAGDDYLELQVAAMEKLEPGARSRHVLLPATSDREEARLVDLYNMGRATRKSLVAAALQTEDQDHEDFLTKLKARTDAAGIRPSEVEVRFHNLTVAANIYVGDRGVPTVTNSYRNFVENLVALTGLLKLDKCKFVLLDNISGILKPGRMTLLLGPPGAGKSTLLKTLANKMRHENCQSARRPARMTDAEPAAPAPAAPAEEPQQAQRQDPPGKERKHAKKEHKHKKKHKKDKHREKDKQRGWSKSPAQAGNGQAEQAAAAHKDGASESGEIAGAAEPGEEARSAAAPAPAADAGFGAKHGRDRPEEDGPRKRPRVDAEGGQDGGARSTDASAAEARPGRSPRAENGAARPREDAPGSSDARRRAERSPERCRSSRPGEERDARRPPSRPRDESRPRREPDRHASRPRDDSRARTDSGRHPSRPRDAPRAGGEPERHPSRPRDDSRSRRDAERHASRPREDRDAARPPSRPRAERRRSPDRRRGDSRERRRASDRGGGDRKRRSRSAEKEDAEFAAKVIAKLEGGEDEDALIEQRRRKRAELVARLQAEQRLSDAAANPTATALGQPSAAGATPPPEPAAAAAPQAAAQPSPAPKAAAVAQPAEPGPEAGEGRGGGPADSETEEEEGLEETTEEQLFQQRRGGGGEPAAAPSPERSEEERHKLPPQAELDMFAGQPVEDMFADAPVGAPDPAAAAAPRRGLLDNYDDSEGYYNFQVGEIMDGRYEVFATHGKGVFSTVLRARDRRPAAADARVRGEAGGGWPEVAIKVIRANDLMSRAGQTEVVILRKLAGADPANKYHTVRLLHTFSYRAHLCLVFEPLESNLRQLTKKYGQGIGLRLDAVRSMAAQMLMALHLMRQCGVLHADIKPDNILINAGHNVVKVCDFGSAMFAGNNEVTPYLVSRFYRAPEVILGLPYDHPMDVWSVGCVIYELFTGRILFPGRSNNEMLKLMMDAKGPFPKKMLKRGEFAAQHFEDDPSCSFCLMELDPLTKRPTKRLIANPGVKRDFKALLAGQEGEPRQVAALVDLLEKMLALDPERRLSAKEALRHPFVREGRPPPRRPPACPARPPHAADTRCPGGPAGAAAAGGTER